MSCHSKFGVPINGVPLGILQPKLKYKFRVLFFGLGYNPDTTAAIRQVKMATRPKVKFTDIDVHSYNSIAYVHGKHEWETVDITFYTDITNGVETLIGEQIQKQMNFHEQTQAVAGANYKFRAEVHTLDGRHTEELEKWDLCGCYINNYTTSDGDYTAGGETNEITITLRYDNAIQLVGPNTNDGTTVGGDPFPNIPSAGGLTGIG